MKRFASILTIFAIAAAFAVALVPPAVAQTLQAVPPPAASGSFSPWVIVAVIAVIAAVVGVVLYLRKHPAAVASLTGALSSAISVIDKQHTTIASQATVIASPPVQAAINAPAAPKPAAANTGVPNVGVTGSGVTALGNTYQTTMVNGQVVYLVNGYAIQSGLAGVDPYYAAVAARDVQEGLASINHTMSPTAQPLAPHQVPDGAVPIAGQ